MHTTVCTVLIAAACCLGIVFIIRACLKVHSMSHNHYRITGDEVRNTNKENDRII